MKVIVGAPVAERAWILPDWLNCLSKQTVQPDGLCFVYSDSKDNTLQLLEEQIEHWNELRILKSKLPFYTRDQRNSDSKDPWRAEHLSQVRNRLRKQFLMTDADVFLSLDTDILLEDPTVIEQLLATLEEGWDVISPCTYLHVSGKESECYNGGVWWGGDPHSFTQGWKRIDSYEVSRPSPIRIDIPMAVYAIRRWTMAMCKYKAHECGEDMGFAQALSGCNAKIGWLKDLEVRHVWGPQFYREAAT